MRVLVTGAAGFIGSTVTDRLLADGHDVIGLDDLSRGTLGNLEQARGHGSFTFVQADVTVPAFAEVVTEHRPEVIAHLAAQIDVRVSVADPLLDVHQNVHGTVNVLEAARRHGVRKVVFTSSGGSIYGSPQQLPVDEQRRVAPESPYAASKAASELFLNAFRALYGLQYTSLALGNVYGPRQDPHGEAGVVAIFGTALLTGAPTKIFGDGTSTRDYVFVADVADAFARAIHAGKADGLRLNIGTNTQTDVRTLHGEIAKILGAADEPVFAEGRLGELQAIQLDVSAAERELGWTPATSLSEGLERTMNWLRPRIVG